MPGRARQSEAFLVEPKIAVEIVVVALQRQETEKQRHDFRHLPFNDSAFLHVVKGRKRNIPSEIFRCAEAVFGLVTTAGILRKGGVFGFEGNRRDRIAGTVGHRVEQQHEIKHKDSQ